MGTAAPDSHPTPSSEPRPNLDQLGRGTCICCVCCTSSTSDKLQPNVAVTSAGLQKTSSDPIIQSMSEMQKRGRAHRLCCHAAAPLCFTHVLPERCSSLPHQQCWESWGAHLGPRSPTPGAPCTQLCALLALCWLPPCSQRSRLFLQPTSNRFCPSAAMRALKASRGRCFCDL